jgi:nicotinamide-nucleotide amidase
LFHPAVAWKNFRGSGFSQSGLNRWINPGQFSQSINTVDLWKAEVIAIGDEIVSGQRLDTNSQWISQRLGEIGVTVHYHSSVGDDLPDHIAILQQAISRADIIVMTGGLGPTADDLTRQAIASALGLDLEPIADELDRIEKIFQSSGRTMPVSNQLQAYFPKGSTIIPNPEGTAAGIDLTMQGTRCKPVRLIALPGVPAEMKQMWSQTVTDRLKAFTQTESTFHYHTLNCFGAGESTIEAMLPDLIQRGRDPKVGITASHATISLRVSTRGTSLIDCQQKMQPTLDLIRNHLKELVFGENQETLADVVLKLLHQQNRTVAIADIGLNGEVESQLQKSQVEGSAVKGCQVLHLLDAEHPLEKIAHQIRSQFQANIGLAIGQIDRNPLQIENGQSRFQVAIVDQQNSLTESHRYWGHSDWRDERAGKQVLNQLRLFITGQR